MRKRNNEFLSFDLTPLIDVVFLLIIFFLVSSVFKKNEKILNVSLPKSGSAESQNTKKENLLIEIKDDSIAVDGKEIEITKLEELLQGLEKSKTLEVHIDQKTIYAKIVKVLDLIKKNKFENLYLVTDSQNE